jgi:transposase
VATQRVGQHRALADQQIAGPVDHQRRLCSAVYKKRRPRSRRAGTRLEIGARRRPASAARAVVSRCRRTCRASGLYTNPRVPAPLCGGTALTRLGADEREVLEYVPSHFKMVVHIRPKMSCRQCQTITQAPAPSLPIERGGPGPSLLAHVLVAKYCDHVPLHRQSVIYGRGGVELERSTVADWVGQAAFLLEPLAMAITRHVRAGAALHADDTPVPVLDPGRGKTKTGRLWVLVGDERPWGGPAPPAVTYLYSPNRKGEHAQTLLEGCRGFLHADGYAGFNGLYEPDTPTGDARLVEVACWAHCRRKLFEVHAAIGSAIAKEALERIATLFKIEAEINGHGPGQRRAVRQERSLPLLANLKDYLAATFASISRKSLLAGAIRYSLSRWPALCQFAHDGRLEMTNNAVERAIRPIATTRSLCPSSSSIWKHCKLGFPARCDTAGRSAPSRRSRGHDAGLRPGSGAEHPVPPARSGGRRP